MAINEKTLLDSWMATGRTYDEFKKHLTELSDATHFVRVNPVEISVLSLKSVNEDKARFWDLQPCNTGGPQDKTRIRSLAIQNVLKKGSHEQLLKESFENVKALFFSDGKLIFPAERIFTRGMAQFGVGGSKMGVPSYERDLYVSSLFRDARKCTFVIREISGAQKLVSILSERYQELPQSALCNIIEALMKVSDFGTMETYMWMMTNWTSEIYVEFPEKADEIRDFYPALRDDFIPGLWLCTSDTGDSSVKIYPTWRYRNAISYVEESAVRQVHSSRITLESVISSVIDKAFKEYARMPEAMCALMEQSITDDSLDISTPRGMAKNREIVESVIKNAFRSLNIVKAIGIGRTKSLREQLCAEFSGNIRYTAYDIATAIMSMPERLEGVNSVTLHNLESAVAEAPYIKYFAGKTETKEEEEDLVLI